MDLDAPSEDLEANSSSDENSEFNEDAYFSDNVDSSPETPLTDAEVQDLIDELLAVESKAAEAQEMLEEESLNAIRGEVKEELSTNLSGSELELAVDEEMATYVEQWQEALDELEDQSSLLQENLDAAGVDLCDLFKWIEKQAPQGCSTEAWKKRIHWAGLHASIEVSTAIRKADDDLNLQRPVRRHHGRSIEEGASGFLQKSIFNSSISRDLKTAQQLDDGWGSIDDLLGNGGDIEKKSGYGTKSWARVYLASTPEQAALLDLPGADQVEEIIDLDKCKDFLTAAAIASEKETGLTEQQKRNLRKVDEDEDIKKSRLIDRIILKRKQKKGNKSSCSVVVSPGLQIGEATNNQPNTSQEIKPELPQKGKGVDEDSSKNTDKVIIEIDSDEEDTIEAIKLTPYDQKKVEQSLRPMHTVDFPKVVGSESKSYSKNDTDMTLSEISMKDGNIELMCTICSKELICSTAYKHPLLPVIVCLPCRQAYTNAEFTKDSTGSYNECSWCANGGSVICCEKCDKVFCTRCIASNFGEEEIERVISAEQWTCYCCNNEAMVPITGSFNKSAKRRSSSSAISADDDFELRANERHRKRLRRILDDSELEESTILKQKLEKERKERLDRLRESAAINSLVPTSSSLQECTINIARDSHEEEVLIPLGIAKFLKPHQIEGVRFMWENCIESIEKVKSGDPGNGCILAHSMGLGKTLQVIAFLYTVLKKKDLGLRTALIVTPVNVLHNWPDEFEKWRPPGVKKLHVYVLDELARNVRKDLLNLWRKTGGVMMIGYTAFRIMSSGRHIKDGFEKVAIHKALKNPGPDILVCDEAHMIKNKKADITQALQQVNTQRRIALTGSPLQNNLMEYYCMVDFVREGFLGRPQDFKNRFQNPIENGQHADSTEYDVKCMKERTHVLHKQLMGFVQRMGASIVEKELPKKIIYVLSIRLSPLQRALYNRFVQIFWLSTEQPPLAAKYRKCLFPTYHALSKVWNHPDLLFLEKDALSEDSMDDSLSEDISADENNDIKKQDKRNSQKTSKRMESEIMKIIESLDWCKDLINDVPHKALENSGKFILLLHILSMSCAKSEKVLIFSQSLLTLDLIESFLEKIPRPGGKAGYWRKEKEWYRLDGHTRAKDRQKLVNRFNDPANLKVQCVLISTKAGSLGINLQAANRVVILDGSWNPTHDIQALFRAWRFGQKKPVFVYRMLAYGTAEEKIYKRQVVKEGLAARVLDAQQVERHSKMEELKILFKLDDDLEELPEEQNAEDGRNESLIHGLGGDAFEDDIMSSLMIHHSPKWIVRIHQHDTLLEDREEEKLTLEEQALAWENFKKITESSTFDWVEGNSGGTLPSSHLQNSWGNGVQAGFVSACSVKFHAELLSALNIRSNDYVRCDNCKQAIGWEHIVKGKSSVTRRK